jgi:hypothetical protein
MRRQLDVTTALKRVGPWLGSQRVRKASQYVAA